MTRARTKTLAQGNAAKIAALLDADEGHADLYRTIEAGPSGQRSDLLVGRIYRIPQLFAQYDFAIVDLSTGDRAGFARLTYRDEWSITAYSDYTGYAWLGYASSLAVGVDVLINGEHAALRRHDHRRISSGSIRKGRE